MDAQPVVVDVEIRYARSLQDLDFLLCGGSACATLSLSDGSTERFSWYHDELSYTPDDFAGQTMAEIAELHRQRDLAYLRS